MLNSALERPATETNAPSAVVNPALIYHFHGAAETLVEFAYEPARLQLDISEMQDRLLAPNVSEQFDDTVDVYARRTHVDEKG
jgi:hypothetical protein